MHWRARLTQKILDNGWVAPDGLPRRSSEGVRVRCLKHTQVFEWETKAHNLIHANKGEQGCRRCYHESLETPAAAVIQATTARGYAYQSHDVRENRTHVTYVCEQGQTHIQVLRAIQGGIVGCGCVKAESRGERTVRSLAERHTGLAWPKARKHELRRLTGERSVPHELDMYCAELRVAIEFDGVQHIGLGPYAKDYEGIQTRDAARDTFCVKHGIKLIRISQGEFDRASKTGLLEWFNDLWCKAFS